MIKAIFTKGVRLAIYLSVKSIRCLIERKSKSFVPTIQTNENVITKLSEQIPYYTKCDGIVTRTGNAQLFRQYIIHNGMALLSIKGSAQKFSDTSSGSSQYLLLRRRRQGWYKAK